MDITFTVQCRECNNELEVTPEYNYTYRDEITFVVPVCPDCKQAAYNEGYSEGERDNT